MAMPQVSNKTLIVLLIIVGVILLFTILYGCACTFEKFEDSEASTEKTMEKKILNGIKQAEAEKEDEAVAEITKNVKIALSAPAPNMEDDIAASPAPAPAPERPVGDELSNQEKELFDQITTNKLSGEEIDKLIKAGVVTEQMIEKFLSQLDSSSEQKITAPAVEGFCAGDCYAKF